MNVLRTSIVDGSVWVTSHLTNVGNNTTPVQRGEDVTGIWFGFELVEGAETVCDLEGLRLNDSGSVNDRQSFNQDCWLATVVYQFQNQDRCHRYLVSGTIEAEQVEGIGQVLLFDCFFLCVLECNEGFGGAGIIAIGTTGTAEGAVQRADTAGNWESWLHLLCYLSWLWLWGCYWGSWSYGGLNVQCCCFARIYRHVAFLYDFVFLIKKSLSNCWIDSM
ncbi:hypothetical protein D3C72_1032120 [compost metagenome]